MVSIKSLAAILAVGVLSATAAPAVEADAIHARQKGTLPSVQACKDKEFGGECKTFEEEAGSCFNFPKGWDDGISSIQNLRPNNFECVWWQHSGCNGEKYDNQVEGNLADGNGAWNDRISAFRCS